MGSLFLMLFGEFGQTVLKKIKMAASQHFLEKKIRRLQWIDNQFHFISTFHVHNIHSLIHGFAQSQLEVIILPTLHNLPQFIMATGRLRENFSVEPISNMACKSMMYALWVSGIEDRCLTVFIFNHSVLMLSRLPRLFKIW